MSEVRSGTATYGGFRTRTLEVAGAGPRIVLFHGFADNADTWTGVLANLAEAGRSALAVDLPGFGSADPLGDGPTLAQHDRFVDDLVDQELAGGQVVLVGNSLGALASMRAASRGRPVAGIVTLAEPTLGDNWRNRQFKTERPSVLVRLLGLTPPLPRAVLAWLVRVVIPFLAYANPLRADRAVRERFALFVVGRGGPGKVAMEGWRLGREFRDGPDLDLIGCPMLVAHGAKDRVIPVNGAHTLHEGVPHSQLHIGPRWGQCPQLDDPSGVARLITDFVDGLLTTDERTG